MILSFSSSNNLLLLHTISSGLMAFVYFCVFSTLFYILKKKPDFSFRKFTLLSLGFIVCCGLTHLLEILAIWKGAYSLLIYTKFITALLFLAIVIIFLKSLPLIISLPTPTALRERVKALKKLKKKISNLLNLSPDIMIVTDDKASIKYANKKAAQSFNFNTQEIVGKSIFTLIAPINTKSESLDQVLAHAMQFSKPQEFIGLTPETKNLSLEAKTSLLDSHHNKTISWSMRDISNRKYIIKKLKQSNRDLKQFAYVASHDLQAPLNHITSFVNFLREELPPEKNSKDIEIAMDFIEKSTVRMKVLIKTFLSLAEIQQQPLNMSEVDLGPLVKNLLREFKSTYPHAQITCQSLMTIKTDESLITQVLQNIISNGLKFQKPNSTPCITIKATETTSSWFISIQDNGIGIDLKHKEKIFLIFKRLHSEKQYSGLGVGLAQCAKIMEKLNGEISFTSEREKGSEFLLTLPKPVSSS